MIGIILQARMGSSRLPGKVLMKIGGKVLLDHILYRLSFLKHKAVFIVATSAKNENDIIADFCAARGVECFRGSETDVLERYYLCAKKYGVEHIVRLTGDNPFTDINELDNLIDLHLSKDFDYSHSFGVLPVGAGAEIFTSDALEKSYRDGIKQNHREHVNEYIQEHPELFKIGVLTVPKEKNRPAISLTIDTEEDYRRACFIADNGSHEFITTVEVIDLCSRFA